MNARFNSMVVNNPKTALTIMFLAIVIACVGFKNLWLSTSFKINFDKNKYFFKHLKKKIFFFP